MMKNGLLCIAAGLAILCSGGPVAAALLYDMEGAPPPSGFGPNGLVSVTQSTIGVTEGFNSMRVEPDAGQTFVGALTGIAPPALSSADGILLDLTINQGEEYAGVGFGDMGVTIYGYKGAVFGISVQFADYTSIAAKSAGTYSDIAFGLDNSIQGGPTFGKSLKQILADGDLDGLTGFQLYFNQTGDSPIVAYIDNIRSYSVPEPATGLLLGIGAIAVGLVARRRR